VEVKLVTHFLNALFPLLGMGCGPWYSHSATVHGYAVGELASEERYLAREQGLDETLAETFPCSDPLSTIPDPHV
jgi:hypothetical protein